MKTAPVPNHIRILGLDPGFASFGAAVLEVGTRTLKPVHGTVFSTEKSAKKRAVRASDDNVDRVRKLATFLSNYIDEWRPMCLAVESMSWPRNASTVGKIGLAWGMLVTVAHERDLAIVQASPQEVRKRLCGKATATGDEIRDAVNGRFLETEGVDWEQYGKDAREHIGDAYAVALICRESDIVRAALALRAILR